MFKSIMRAVMPLSLLLHCFLAEAGVSVNPITVNFQAGTTTFITGGTGTASYLVSIDDSVKPPGYPLTMSVNNLPNWATQITSGGTACSTAAETCGNLMSLSAGEHCCLMLSLNGANLTAGSYSIAPIVATTPKATYQGQATATAVTVKSGTALSVISPTDPQILTVFGSTPINGSATLSFTVKNTGSVTALNVTASNSSWYGVIFTPEIACTSLAPQATCTIVLSSTSAIANLAGTFNVHADNATAVASPAAVAFEMSGGLVFAKTGTTTGRATVVSESDNNPMGGIIWSSNGNGALPADVSYDTLPGIDQTSQAPSPGSPSYDTFSIIFGTTYTNTLALTSDDFQQCNGKSDGACNVLNILAFYNYYKTNYDFAHLPPPEFTADALTAPSTPLSDYAAGICSSYNDGVFTDWYLPAICELGVFDVTVGGTDAGCGSNIDNIQINLFNLGFLAGLLTYWSSTEWEGSSGYFAWIQIFDGISAGSQYTQQKNSKDAVRCVRAFDY